MLQSPTHVGGSNEPIASTVGIERRSSSRSASEGGNADEGDIGVGRQDAVNVEQWWKSVTGGRRNSRPGTRGNVKDGREDGITVE